MTQPSSTPTESAIRAQAREWFICLRDNPTHAERQACEQWREADPRHEAAWQSVSALWDATAPASARLAREEADKLSVYLTAMDQARYRRRGWRQGAAVSLALACVLAVILWFEQPGLLQNTLADYSTARAERRSVQLTDGSTVLLDADSALKEAFTQGERRVELLRGTALFDVRHSDIPFVVSIPSGEIRVLGTRFSVEQGAERSIVTLERGSVAVTAEHADKPVMLKPGQQLALRSGEILQPWSVNVSDALAWQDGRFVFYRQRLADVVQEIQRYQKGRIIITRDALANERVTGSFSLANPDAALASLQDSVGFETWRFANRLTIIR